MVWIFVFSLSFLYFLLSFPRKRESMSHQTLLDPRFRGNDRNGAFRNSEDFTDFIDFRLLDSQSHFSFFSLHSFNGHGKVENRSRAFFGFKPHLPAPALYQRLDER